MLRQTNFDPGGFAEYIRLPAINVDRGVFPISDDLSYQEATFHEPLGCVLRAHRIARLKPGQSVLVFGCGIAGLLNVSLAKALGASLIMAVDPVSFRLQAAKRFGADKVFKPSENIEKAFRRINSGRLADLVLVCTGAGDAFLQSLRSVERGGTVLFFAPSDPGLTIPLPINDLFFRNDITLTTSYGASPYDSCVALEIVARATNSLKVMIEPQK
jgi:L-iditol 2-dehydrogenase